MSSPTQRSLAWLKKYGYEPGIVERWIQQARKRIDLLNCIDIVAVKEGVILGVQTTSDSSLSAHYKKCLAEPKLRLWLLAGGRFALHGWSKKGARGKRKLWQVRVILISLEDFDNGQ